MNTAHATAATPPRGSSPGAAAGFFISRKWRGQSYLISPLVDWLMVGGLAFLMIPILHLLVPKEVMNDVTAQPYSAILAFVLLNHVFLINYPHFAYSYQLLYTDFGARLRGEGIPRHMQIRYIWAGVVMPLCFVLYCLAGYVTQNPVMLGYLVNFMFFTVGWHYAKQSFGVMVVVSALKQIYYNGWQRKLLLANVHLLWVVAWIGGNIAVYENQFWGLKYSSIAMASSLPALFSDTFHLHQFLYGLLKATSVAVVGMILLKAWRDRRLPSFVAITGYTILYPFILVGGMVGHPLWGYIVPALHSLQYLTFVFAYQWNKKDEAARQAADQEARKQAGWGLGWFLVLGFIIGGLQFEWVPRLLNNAVHYSQTFNNTTFFLAIFHLFINIHHYFIDNVIWRKDNPHVGRYLMVRR